MLNPNCKIDLALVDYCTKRHSAGFFGFSPVFHLLYYLPKLNKFDTSTTPLFKRKTKWLFPIPSGCQLQLNSDGPRHGNPPIDSHHIVCGRTLGKLIMWVVSLLTFWAEENTLRSDSSLHLLALPDVTKSSVPNNRVFCRNCHSGMHPWNIHAFVCQPY